jgi:catechol 2,3-dioxygenase-like lactoylglutathione lyase family enzyme
MTEANDKLFLAAFPFAEDVLALPVTDLDRAAAYYEAFGLAEVERSERPPTLIMERDGVRLGFCINGKDATQDGAAIRVSDIQRARTELESHGIKVANSRIDERDGTRFRVFFVVAPDGLCFYFNQAID